MPPMAERHVEIAGAGLAGLTVAALLARRGWNVRVHERADELREIGAGIFLWENALRALADAGAIDEAIGRAERIEAWRLYDERGRLVQDGWMNPVGVRLYTGLRTDLHRALASAARRAGAQIVTGSEVAAATAAGELVMTGGDRVRADLVIGADGVRSPVREALGLTRRLRDLEDGCGRHLVARLPSDPVGRTLEYWNGARRVGVVPVTAEEVYVYLCCPASDAAGCATPVDAESWSASFPALRDLIRRIPDVGRWAVFYDVVCHSWCSGRGCVIGDAAHAMSPNLGQGACLAMANARSLAYALDRYPTVVEALARWEASERFVTDATQRYSRLYGRVGTKWPAALLTARSRIVKVLGRSRRVQQRVNIAAGYSSPLVASTPAPADSLVRQ
jgi:2-polyprenyl-6-methoxyphenol hydroxylase-like FAD-dependent oxidoreductase